MTARGHLPLLCEVEESVGVRRRSGFRGRLEHILKFGSFLFVDLKQIARNLRRKQTYEEKELWRALRSRRFAGFKFRRQHALGDHILDFYCADAKLAVELDGFQHGRSNVIREDETRRKCLEEQGIETLRFWNHEWRKNREGCLLEIWDTLQLRSGCIRIIKNVADQRFVPPETGHLKSRSPEP